MRGKLIVAFLAVLFLLQAIALAADNIEITAPSSVFIPEGRGSDFRFFVKNGGESAADVYLNLNGYIDAKFWGAPQPRSFTSFLFEQNDRQMTITNFVRGKIAEFFVRMGSDGIGSLSIMCGSNISDNSDCGSYEITVNVGDVPSFSVINIYSIFLILFASLLIFSKIK